MEGKEEIFNNLQHIYGYMGYRERGNFIGYSFQLAARNLLYGTSYPQTGYHIPQPLLYQLWDIA